MVMSLSHWLCNSVCRDLKANKRLSTTMVPVVALTYRAPPLGQHPKVSDKSLAGDNVQGLSLEQFERITLRLGLDSEQDESALKVYLLNFNSIRSHYNESNQQGLQS